MTYTSRKMNRVTPARKAIMALLERATAPLSYEQIKQQINFPMDKATFYRNISLFESQGLVDKFESDDRKWYFELRRSAHAHFICDACHQITCMELDIGSIDLHVKSIVIKGTCKACDA